MNSLRRKSKVSHGQTRALALAFMCLLLLFGISNDVWAVGWHYTYGNNVVVSPPGATDQSVYGRGLWVDGDTGYLVFVDNSKVWFSKSANAGKTWSSPVQVDTSATVSQYMPCIVVDSSGRIHVAWIGYPSSYSEIWYAYSANAGQSFTGQKRVSLAGSGAYWLSDPRIDVGDSANRVDGGDVCIVWESVPAASGSNTLYFNKSTDGGGTFGSPVTVRSATLATGMSLTPDIAVDSGGQVHVVWGDYDGTDGYAAYSGSSTGASGSWSSPVRISMGTDGDNEVRPSIDTDSSNNLFVAWSQASTSGRPEQNVYFSRSSDAGATWTTQVQVNDTAADKNLDEVDCGPVSLRVFDYAANADLDRPTGSLDGVIVGIAWRDTRLTTPFSSSGGIYYAASADGGDNWGCNVPVDSEMGQDGHTYYQAPPTLGLNGKLQAFVAFAHTTGTYRTVFAARGHPTKWRRYGDQPVFSPGTAGAWDDFSVRHPRVFRAAAQYRMWYSGNQSGGHMQIGRAVSTDGVNWSRDPATPVIQSNQLPPYDSGGVSFPVIIRDAEKYQAWVSGFSGSNYYALYYTSTDGGRTWTAGAAAPVLSPGASGAWDDTHVRPCSVIRNGQTYVMWYWGFDGATGAIGVATSTNGATWTKYSGNPVFSPVAGTWEKLVGECWVDYRGGTYSMFYGGFDRAVKLGYAVSSDGYTWTRATGTSALWTQTDTPWFGPAGNGWDRFRVDTPSRVVTPDMHAMYYTGYSGISADEGNIGLITREYNDPSEWDTANFTLTLPAGSSAADYRMSGVPLGYQDSAAASVLGPVLGTYDPVYKRVGRWNPGTQSYLEYPDVGAVGGGWAGWFLFREGLSHTFTGYKRYGYTDRGYLGLGYRSVTVQPGWNQVSNPFNHSVDLNGVIVATDTMGSNTWLLSPYNNLTQPAFWVWDGSYSAVTSLPAGGAGWVKNVTDYDQYLQFMDTTASFPPQAADARLQDSLELPPDPPGGFSEPAGGGGGGGCFVSSAAR